MQAEGLRELAVPISLISWAIDDGIVICTEAFTALHQIWSMSIEELSMKPKGKFDVACGQNNFANFLLTGVSELLDPKHNC